MIAAKYLAPNRIEPLDIPPPALSYGHALVEVEACGMCGSDLGILSGLHPRARAPLTIGHEFCGRIVEIHSDHTELRPGDRVAAYPLISCGTCLACRTGHAHVCRVLRLYGIDAPGGMAQLAALPAGNLIPLPPDMNWKVGALIEPLAVAVHGVSGAPLAEAHTVAVIGAGPIGLLTALVARARGAPQVLISDILPSRIELARHLGLTAFSAGSEMAEAVAGQTGGEGADLVFECAGVPASAQSMTALTRCRGTIVNLGVFKKPAQVDLQALNFKEITLSGSRVYTRDNFNAAIRLASRLPLEQVVTHTFPIADVSDAFDKFKAGEGVCKILVRP